MSGLESQLTAGVLGMHYASSNDHQNGLLNSDSAKVNLSSSNKHLDNQGPSSTDSIVNLLLSNGEKISNETLSKSSMMVPLAASLISPILAASTNTHLSSLSVSPPFSSQHLIQHQSYSMTQGGIDGVGLCESELTPVNTNKVFQFARTPIAVDSGTESICSESAAVDDDYLSETASDKILKFFASEKSKFNRLANRRPTAGCIRQNSDDQHEEIDDEVEDDVFSDESTLSECSALSSPDFATPRSNEMIVTVESVVAAIDKKLKQEKLVIQPANIVCRSDNANQKTIEADSGNAINSTNNNLDAVCFENNATACNKVSQVHVCAKMKKRTEKNPLLISGSSFELEVNGEDSLISDLVDDETDESLLNAPRAPLIRSTSLKTGKTPPGTPGSKKIVRFADALGLDLESVRHIVDDVPYVPPLAAFKALKLDDEDRNWLFRNQPQQPIINSLPLSKPNLRILFCQPSSDPAHFIDRVRFNKVCMENCLVSGPSGSADLFTITTIVRVLNIGFHKSVTLRYTTNEWLTWTDVNGTYIPDSCDGFSDKFSVSFQLAVNANGHQTMMPGQRLMFALKYICNSSDEFWDNNMGLNYALIYQRI